MFGSVEGLQRVAFGRRGACLLTLLLALACGGAEDARAATGTAVGTLQPEGYARLVFAFDSLPKAQARLQNGVLVIDFAQAVTLDTKALTRGLGDLVGVIRRDPDGSSLRIALTRPATLNVTEAGEALYVDLLPANWVGVPPGLPKDVIAELGRTAREIRKAQAKAAATAAMKLKPLTLEGATHPTFRRLVFGVDDALPVTMTRAGDAVAVTFGAAMPFDLPAAKAALPQEFASLGVKRTAGALTVMVPAASGVDVRDFREDGSYILDIDRAGNDRDASAAQPTPTPTPIPTPSAAPAEPQAAPAAPVRSSSAEAVRATPAVEVAMAAPAAAHPDEAPAAAIPAPAPSTPPAAPGHAEIRSARDTVRVVFPFAKSPAAAVFVRGRTVWAVFDDPAPMALDGLVSASGGVVSAVTQSALESGRLVKLTLREPRLVTAAVEGPSWIVSLGDDILDASQPVAFAADFSRNGRGALAAEVDRSGLVRAFVDPELGDRLLVATLPGPVQGLSRPRSFVEFGLLATAQGVAVTPIADDVRMVAGMDALRVERDDGLALSSGADAAAAAAAPPSRIVFDANAAAAAMAGPYREGERKLLDAAALAPPEERTAARLGLARFYAFRQMAAEAKAVLDVVTADDIVAERDPSVAILRAVAALDLGRPEVARELLAVPALTSNPEAALWRAQAEYDDNHPALARDALRAGQAALDRLPDAIRARFAELSIQLALDAKDAAAAAAAFDQLEVLPAIRGVAAREVLRGRILEALGRTDRALAAYAAVVRSGEPAPAAEATLRGAELGVASGRTSTADATATLERLVTGWRGDRIEGEGLARLAGLYADAERWRDAFGTLKTVATAFPEADETRVLQDNMQARFTDLFLGPAIDHLPKLDALALFYDFQELSPGGRRGDELVRRLSGKLVDVDLLDQASQLLDYQIDNRLTGAARAQVAARSALVHLMNGKPAEAARVLRKTRQADLPASLVRTRLLLEARALAQSGRVDLALEIADGADGTDGVRLKADMLWAANRWNEAGEALEASLGASWRAEEPLDRDQRSDVMRAAIALSLADDRLGLDRIRQKFAPKMAASADAQSFEVVTAPIEVRGAAFKEIARSIAATAALDGFLREYRARSAEEAPAMERAAETAAPRRG